MSTRKKIYSPVDMLTAIYYVAFNLWDVVSAE